MSRLDLTIKDNAIIGRRDVKHTALNVSTVSDQLLFIGVYFVCIYLYIYILAYTFTFSV